MDWKLGQGSKTYLMARDREVKDTKEFLKNKPYVTPDTGKDYTPIYHNFLTRKLR